MAFFSSEFCHQTCATIARRHTCGCSHTMKMTSNVVFISRKQLIAAVSTHVSAHTVMYCTVLYCTVLYCTVLYCTVLYCTVLYCTVLYCTVLYCTVLYCTVPNYITTTDWNKNKKNCGSRYDYDYDSGDKKTYFLREGSFKKTTPIFGTVSQQGGGDLTKSQPPWQI